LAYPPGLGRPPKEESIEPRSKAIRNPRSKVGGFLFPGEGRLGPGLRTVSERAKKVPLP
jgi:hypothetical protein